MYIFLGNPKNRPRPQRILSFGLCKIRKSLQKGKVFALCWVVTSQNRVLRGRFCLFDLLTTRNDQNSKIQKSVPRVWPNLVLIWAFGKVKSEMETSDILDFKFLDFRQFQIQFLVKKDKNWCIIHNAKCSKSPLSAPRHS